MFHEVALKDPLMFCEPTSLVNWLTLTCAWQINLRIIQILCIHVVLMLSRFSHHSYLQSSYTCTAFVQLWCILQLIPLCKYACSRLLSHWYVIYVSLIHIQGACQLNVIFIVLISSVDVEHSSIICSKLPWVLTAEKPSVCDCSKCL